MPRYRRWKLKGEKLPYNNRPIIFVLGTPLQLTDYRINNSLIISFTRENEHNHVESHIMPMHKVYKVSFSLFSHDKQDRQQNTVFFSNKNFGRQRKEHIIFNTLADDEISYNAQVFI